MSNRHTNSSKSLRFPVAGIGASAGGLEALIALLKFLPKNVNMAFVLIQHLEPLHKSALAEILSRETLLTVREARNNTKIERAHVYVIPPNTLMAVSRRRLRLTSRIKRVDGRYLPIDFFMTSLAKDQGASAIGIILSGTGTDGTQGAQAIKAKGGIVFAQDEKTARYFGMPESVIASGSADFVLGPSEIAQKLLSRRTPGERGALKRTDRSLHKQDNIERILVLLRDLAGVDFLHYKKNTIERRIERQMAFHNIKNHADYYDHLKANPAEANVLRKDILIPVTYFFRDPELYAVLRKKVFSLITQKRSPQNPVRLWVPACSSGEEAYSLAMLLYEFLEARKGKPYIQVFGTDLSEASIEKARAGVYAPDISAHVSTERLRRFFIKTETGYKIARPIRDLCIFARHDITGDPPLSNMDIVSCRNLLIYLDAFLQNKALSLLHYALKPRGFLVLGTAESVTAAPDLFTAFDKKQKIYSRNIVPRKGLPALGTPTTVFAKTKENRRPGTKKVLSGKDMGKRDMIVHAKKKGLLKTAGSDQKDPRDTDKNIVKLKKEFARTVERLNAISEEKDTFNEELKAANEEIQSSNEELQSMNEELETSKEELQSTNEELLTLNEELQNKNADLSHLNSDLSNVFSSTNIPIIIVGNDLRIKRFTPTARKVMNLIPSDVDRPVGDIKLNIDIAPLEEMLLGVIEDMIPKEVEARDKEGRWYSVRIRPYRTIDNKIDGAIISLIDIDAIKRSREEMQNTRDYNQAIIETMREPLLVLDKGARVLSANRAFYNMFKIQMSDVKGKSLYEIGNRQWDHPGLRKLLEDILPRKTHFNDFEMSFNPPGLGPKTMVLNGRQIKMHGKESPLILLVIEDMTKRKKAEDILRRDNKTLDKLVHKRSKDLVRLQLELERAKHLSAIGTLAATVAHELRNPLADIALSTYRIKKIVQDPLADEILAGISARILESNQIISNILMYSKSTTTTTTTTPHKPVKLNDILKDSIEDEVRQFPTGQTLIHEKMDRTNDLSIEVDPVWIKEVFRNLLNNALAAVSADTGRIEVETEILRSGVSVKIKDNGEGIAKKDLKNVASPFFTTKAKGTGLGLAVCKQLVTRHGGSIDIQSVKEKGTTVTVTLPIQKLKDA